MTNEQLKAAAERVRLCRNGASGDQILGMYQTSNWGEALNAMCDDEQILVDAYLSTLAAEADGDEPVTEEWLRSIGAKDEYEYRHDGQDVYGLYLGPAKWFNFTNGSELLIDHREGYVIKTRRAVRQLLAALQIPTTKGLTNET